MNVKILCILFLDDLSDLFFSAYKDDLPGLYIPSLKSFQSAFNNSKGSIVSPHGINGYPDQIPSYSDRYQVIPVYNQSFSMIVSPL
jgi:hypothetical protein